MPVASPWAAGVFYRYATGMSAEGCILGGSRLSTDKGWIASACSCQQSQALRDRAYAQHVPNLVHDNP